MPVEKASVMLVTDTSGSMNATDVSPTRLAAAQAAATRFLDKVPDQLQVGLVAYADGPHTVLRPTQDRAQIKSTIAALTADGGTATGDALDSALTALGRRRSRPRSCCSPTAPARPAPTRPRSPRRRARPRSRSTPSRSAPPDGTVDAGGQLLSVPPDPEALKQVADISGGKAFTAEDSDALDEVYETLGSRIGTRKEKKEVSAGFAAIGLLMLGGAAFTTLRWRGRSRLARRRDAARGCRDPPGLRSPCRSPG